MPRARSISLTARLAAVRLFLCDVDGILTDCSVFMDGQTEWKQFNVQDGLGLHLLQRFGVRVGWISGRSSPATDQRARDLKVDFLYQGPERKVAVAEKYLAQLDLTWAQVSYMGDDLLDLGILRRAGAAISVPNGCAEAQAQAHYVTKAVGGHGAVREVVDLILRAQKHWDNLVEEYRQ